MVLYDNTNDEEAGQHSACDRASRKTGEPRAAKERALPPAHGCCGDPQNGEAGKRCTVMKTVTTCLWTEDDDATWGTACGQAFTIIEGTPKENGMKFCCYCGGQLEQKRHEVHNDE